MAREIAAIDITKNPALRKLAKEVRDSGRPRVLRENGEDVAKVVPLRPAPKRKRRDPEADRQAFLASAGSWKGLIDLDQFLKDNRASRDIPGRPPVGL
jgi:hypothetical protein